MPSRLTVAACAAYWEAVVWAISGVREQNVCACYISSQLDLTNTFDLETLQAPFRDAVFLRLWSLSHLVPK